MYKIDQPYWIGLHDRNVEGKYHWLDEVKEVTNDIIGFKKI